MPIIVPTEPGSVEHDEVSKGFKLVNDELAPGNNKVYGTDGAGTKGWQDAPSVVWSTDNFTTGGTSLFIRFEGSGSPTYIQTSPGVFTLTMPAGTSLRTFSLTGNNGTLDPGLAFTLVLSSVDGEERRFNSQIYNLGNNQIADQHGGGNSPKQPVTGAGEISAKWENMNLYGASGFEILGVVI